MAASLPIKPAAAHVLAASAAPRPYQNHQQNTRLGSPEDKPGLEEHQKAVAVMESWLDYGVLKALGEEAEYCRVDATLMLLAVNDTKVRR